MNVCEHCGSELEPTDAFCGVCGSFAAWTEAEPATEPATTDLSGAASPQAEPHLAEETESSTAGQAEPMPAPRNPAAVRPGTPSIERAPARPADPGYVAAPDDILCAACQASNPSGRKFCRRCGTVLIRLVPQRRRSWWRRFLGWFAGWRHRRRLAREHGRWRIVGWLLVLLALGGGIGIGTNYLLHHDSTVKSKVQAHFATPKPLNPRTATASSAAPGHPAGAAVDGASDTWWSPAAGSGTGQWLQAAFAGPHTLLDVQVMIGASQEQNAFLLQARPSALRLIATTATGATVVQHLALADKTGFQQFHVLIRDAVSARLTIDSVDGAGPGRLTALAEVEFFADS